MAYKKRKANFAGSGKSDRRRQNANKWMHGIAKLHPIRATPMTGPSKGQVGDVEKKIAIC